MDKRNLLLVFLALLALLLGGLLLQGRLALRPKGEILLVKGEAAADYPREPTPIPSDSTAFLVNLNTADQAMLMQLPGIGERYAEEIVRLREERGGFSALEELLEISGIGEKTLENLRPLVVLG